MIHTVKEFVSGQFKINAIFYTLAQRESEILTLRLLSVTVSVKTDQSCVKAEFYPPHWGCGSDSMSIPKLYSRIPDIFIFFIFQGSWPSSQQRTVQELVKKVNSGPCYRVYSYINQKYIINLCQHSKSLDPFFQMYDTEYKYSVNHLSILNV